LLKFDFGRRSHAPDPLRAVKLPDWTPSGWGCRRCRFQIGSAVQAAVPFATAAGKKSLRFSEPAVIAASAFRGTTMTGTI
jgi:hypothetical protein